MHSFISLIIKIIVIILAFLTISGYFEQKFYVFDILNSFRIQYFVLLVLTFTFSLIIGDWGTSAASFILAIMNFAVIHRSQIFTRRPEPQRKTLKAFSANVLRVNNQHLRLISQIEKQSPDIVVLIEVDDIWMSVLETLKDSYPYSLVETRNDNYGLALLSRIPIIEGETIITPPKQNPTLRGIFKIGDQDLGFLIVHPPPPKNRNMFKIRNQELDHFAEYLEKFGGAKILFGDLNVVPWSITLLQFLSKTKMINSGIGFGIQPSWRSRIPFLLAPIDHILVSKEVIISNRYLGDPFKSDHLPIILEFCLVSKDS